MPRNRRLGGPGALHPLDNPFWHAMTGPQRARSLGDDRARRYLPGVATQCALSGSRGDAYEALATLVEVGEAVDLFRDGREPGRPGWRTVLEVELLQMVWARPAAAVPCAFVELGEGDMPEMLRLAEATHPGPFLAGAISLGRFVGVREDGRLVAMAGERAHPEGFREISGVCTLPEYRRRGYARALVHELASSRLGQGEIPFLHVELRNAAAIRGYERLGFVPRRRFLVAVLRRTGGV